MITAGTAMKHTHDAMRQPPNAESSEPPRPIAETEAVGWQRSEGDGRRRRRRGGGRSAMARREVSGAQPCGNLR